MLRPLLSIILQPSTDSKINERGVVEIQTFFKKMKVPLEVLTEKSVKDSALKAQGDFIFYMEPSLPVPLVEVIKFLTVFEEGFEVIVTDRPFWAVKKSALSKIFSTSFKDLKPHALQLGLKVKNEKVMWFGN